MTEEKEEPKGLKFQYRDGRTGELVADASDEPKKEVKKEEEKDNAITNTTRGSRRKD